MDCGDYSDLLTKTSWVTLCGDIVSVDGRHTDDETETQFADGRNVPFSGAVCTTKHVVRPPASTNRPLNERFAISS